MDVAADEVAVAGEGLHGVGEDVAGDGLDDVFSELGTEGFNPVPFFVGEAVNEYKEIINYNDTRKWNVEKVK
jgi:hypothetical protein